MKASTVEKRKLKQTWENKQHSTNRSLAQNRVRKEINSNRHMNDLANPRRYGSESTPIQYYDESSLLVQRMMTQFNRWEANQNRTFISSRVASLTHYRQEITAFLSCRQKLGLSKDVARYICSWLVPRRELIEIDEEKNVIKRTDWFTGEMEYVSLPEEIRASSERVDVIFEPLDGELWCFGETIFALDTNENFRQIENQELVSFKESRESGSADSVWAGNRLFFFIAGEKDMIFEPHPKTGTLRLMPDSLVPKRAECASEYGLGSAQFVSALCGDMLFLLTISDCVFYPSEIAANSGCMCCDGENYKRIKKAENCCVVLQVLYLSDLEHGWSAMKPPSIHYHADLKPPQMRFDLETKMLHIIGGCEKKNSRKKSSPIIGGYSLNLTNSRRHSWRHDKTLTVPSEGFIIEHARK